MAWDVEGRPPISIGLPDGVADDAESWLDYLYEFRTRYGLLYSRAVRFVRGSFDSWDDWEPRALDLIGPYQGYNQPNIEEVQQP